MKPNFRPFATAMILIGVPAVLVTIPARVHLASAETYDRRIDVGSEQTVTDRDGNVGEPQTGRSGGTTASDTTLVPSASLDDADAIFYEISYNAAIQDSVIISNAMVKGRFFAAQNDDFPVAAIYPSEAGGPRHTCRAREAG